jgi:type II secretory pathway component GspD/PulD (secretin)
MNIDKQNAKELLDVLMNSQSHNPAWALKEVLQHLREKLSNTFYTRVVDDDNKMYVYGYDECLNDIDMICNELDEL